MFNMSRCFNRLIVAPTHIKHVHFSVSYQWAICQNTIGVVINRLVVGMGLKGSPGGALYLSTCTHNYGTCNGILNIE